MILILIETRFAALSSLTRSISLEISSHGLSLPIQKFQKLLNWHESTTIINSAVPLTFTMDILLLRRVKLSLLIHSFDVEPTVVSFSNSL